MGTAIGIAMIADYWLRGGKSPAVILGLEYAGLLMQNTRMGIVGLAVFASVLYAKKLWRSKDE